MNTHTHDDLRAKRNSSHNPANTGSDKARNSFQFGALPGMPAGSVRPLLIWRILTAREEVRDGRIQLLKQPVIQYIRENEADFSEYNRALAGHIKELIEKTGRVREKNLAPVAVGVASVYRKEMLSLNEGQIAFDILYQTIQLLALNPTRENAERTILGMGRHYDGSILSEQDRGRIFRCFRAYVQMAREFASLRSMRSALEVQDRIITDVHRAHPEVSLIFLDRVYRGLVAQVLLSRKFKCDTLLVEWLKEYGLEPDHMVRVSRYIPYDTGFWTFRKNYTQAIRNLKEYRPESDNPLDSDLFLLRSLAIFYTSWIVQTSQQLPAA